jgi:competence ComEA-like helix-hairpin-helix protein
MEHTLNASRYFIDINNAPSSELTLIPGIGPRLSEEIVRHRGRYGPFRSVDLLLEVKGLGPGKAREIAKWIARDEEGSIPITRRYNNSIIHGAGK